LTKAKVITSAREESAQEPHASNFLVEFEGPRGWCIYEGQTFETYVGAAAWIAAQGAELVD
jgi:hypothetical protein